MRLCVIMRRGTISEQRKAYLMDTLNIFLTGGLDSSYSVLYYSRYEINIQPIYLKDKRASEQFELKAINDILEFVKNDSRTKAVILPLIIDETDRIAKNNKITDAYYRITSKLKLGRQYDWLQRYAVEHGHEGILISATNSPEGKVKKVVLKYGALKKQQENGYEFYKVDTEKSHKDLNTLFGNIMFSVTWDMTKQEEIKDLHEKGLDEAVKMIWFCFTPVDGKPCGCCNPCKSYFEENLLDFFDEASKKRYELTKNCERPTDYELCGVCDNCRKRIENGDTAQFSEAALARYKEYKSLPEWRYKLRDMKARILRK